RPPQSTLFPYTSLFRSLDSFHKLLLEKVQGEVFFGFEVVEQSALGNFCLSGDGLGGRVIKPFFRKKTQGRLENGAAGAFFVFIPDRKSTRLNSSHSQIS